MNLEVEDDMPACSECGHSNTMEKVEKKDKNGKDTYYCGRCGLFQNTTEPRCMQLSLIVCVSRNGVIGIEGRLPMRLPSDLRRFRIITSNKPVIMGRKTHESIGRTLLNRTNIVLSNQKDYPVHEGSILAPGLSQAYEAAYATGASHAFVIGGGEIFRHFLIIASKVYITIIDEELEGDTFFPIAVEEMLKWEGRKVQTFDKSPTNAAKQVFHILDVPPIEELVNLYDDPPFEVMHKMVNKSQELVR